MFHGSAIMKITGNTILITGGATGIGFALAEAFIERGNEVITCSRSEDKLNTAKKDLPQLHTRRCDVSKEQDLTMLHDWIATSFPEMNILVNNAGIQREIDFRRGTEDLFRHRDSDGGDELDINLRPYIYLSAYFVPMLMRTHEAAIMNVSSGLGFIPMAIAPVYSATKAAVHSFSISLRHQLKDTPVKVFEIIPPTVDTDLDNGARKARGQTDLGISPEEVAKAVLLGMEADRYEIAVGTAMGLMSGSKTNFDEVFARINSQR
jgi:uncharacterized oxidoreductase